MELYNYMEEVVYRYVDEVLKKFDNEVCKCEKCRLDIIALALNNLPPRYTVTEKGKLFTKVKEMESQYGVDIIREITKAIEVVSKKPRHDC
ncbi:competence protein ComFB [Proteiniborus ethanoligenes]|uniref:Competence protein ComFB n=1 Tax=Proteiniborus ethanoligenes TaxID=415015 RepID=A0A1H3K781_9FIRM|nr:late competence development ComFB family protein [Proteiniborus ethanoligenes]SDY48041.1 competence protein ComFB [Proteiniborus ethanoligenes]